MLARIASLVVACLSAASLAGCSPLTLTLGGTPADNQLRTAVVRSDGGAFADRVAIVDVSGMIYNANNTGLLGAGENPVGILSERLDEARKDSRVKAVILRVNSPGGTVTATDAMYREVLRFKKDTGKPVVALMMDVAASGGYYLSCSADEIIAYPSTVTGSIGVIFQTMSFKDGLSRIGIRTEAITSGPNKDVASPLGEMTNEHRAILKSLVSDFYARFTAVVKQTRPKIPADKFAYCTDGRVVSGTEAFTLGLVDELGDIDSAFELAKKKAGITAANLVVYHRKASYAGSVYAQSPAGPPVAAGTQINVAQINLGNGLAAESSGFYYLWHPEVELSR